MAKNKVRLTRIDSKLGLPSRTWEGTADTLPRVGRKFRMNPGHTERVTSVRESTSIGIYTFTTKFSRFRLEVLGDH